MKKRIVQSNEKSEDIERSTCKDAHCLKFQVGDRIERFIEVEYRGALHV